MTATGFLDTIPTRYYKDKKIQAIEVFSDNEKVNVTYNDGSKENITTKEAKKRGFYLPVIPPLNSSLHLPPPKAKLKYVYPKEDVGVKQTSPGYLVADTIPGKKVKTFEQEPNNGNVIITYEDGAKETLTKEEATARGFVLPPPKGTKVIQQNSDKIFTKVENEAEFPGGKEAWIKYIIGKIKKNQDLFTKKDFGTCVVKFIVNTDGSTSKVEATTMKDSQLASITVDAIRNGPKWIPAKNNDQVVASYRLEPVTLTEPK